MMFIILDSEQADIVRSTTPPAALNPVERAGGVFILGVSVLNDPAHEVHWEFLDGLPRLAISDPSFPGELEEV